MNRIIIKGGTATVRTIPARGDRAAISFKEQRAAIECGEDFPQPFNVPLSDDQPPYPPGDYLIDVSSLTVDEYGKAKIGRRLHLIPVPASMVVTTEAKK